MAFCSSSAGLCNGVYFSDDCSTGVKIGKLSRENKVFNARALGLSASARTRCRTIVMRPFLSSYHETRRKRMIGIRNMLVPREFGSGSESVTSPSIKTLQEERDVSVAKDTEASEMSAAPVLDEEGGGGDGGNGKFHSGGGGGNGGDDTGDDKEEEEFGPLLKFEEVIREAEARGASLPTDMLGAAKSIGIRKVLLDRYLELQDSAWPLGFAIRTCSLLRNRMLADPTFLFKIGTEIVIDSCCATFAEIQKRGKDFWNEFELYVADLLVGVVVNVALVGLLAPYARIGQPSSSKGLSGRIQRAYGALPSSVFEAERPGCKFSIQQRLGTYFFKGFLYASVGFVCGLVGQGVANLIMNAKRSIKKSEEDIPVPPLMKSAALWGVFLAVSSNTRYQIINLLERLVEASPLAKRIPAVASAFTVGVRFTNNVYGGMQFVDWARWSGVQ